MFRVVAGGRSAGRGSTRGRFQVGSVFANARARRGRENEEGEREGRRHVRSSGAGPTQAECRTNVGFPIPNGANELAIMEGGQPPSV